MIIQLLSSYLLVTSECPKVHFVTLGFIYDVLIEIHEIVTQIMLMSDFRVIVHCHSIHLILLLHFWFVNSSGTSDLVCILHFFIAPLWKSGAILDSPCPSVVP